MPKNILQDVIKIKKRNQILILHDDNTEEVPKKSKYKYKLYLLALVSITALFFAFSFLFAKATITVNPKIQNISINQNLSATKDGNSSSFSFNLMTIAGEEDKNVQGGTAKSIIANARGSVFIYNTYSTTPQVLAKDTQLVGSNGKIYKTLSKMTIPGMSKTAQPGRVEGTIYASNPGEEYNSPPLDFNVMLFKGTSKYTLIYGRSDGNITGGLKGKYYQITDAQKAAAVSELTTALQTKLLGQATAQIPPGFILFKDAVFLNVDNNVSTASSATAADSMVPVKLTGTLYGFLFNEQELTAQIAQNYEGSQSGDVHIPNLQNLTFLLTNKDNASFADVQNINFNLTGAAKVVWNVDSAKLMNDLLGKSKKDLTQILSGYPYIDSADVAVSPFWIMSFPDKAKNITITVNEQK